MGAEPTDVRSAPRRLTSATAAGVALLAGAVLLANISITGSYDDSCGSILASRAVWASRSACGIAHRGTIGVVLGLASAGFWVLTVGWLGRTGTSRLNRAARVLLVATSAATAATTLLALRVVTYDEPVLRRGWAAVRNAAGITSIGLGLITAVVIGSTLTRHPHHRSSAHGTQA